MIYHLALVTEWDKALAEGDYRISTIGVTLEQRGFIHASGIGQVRKVANTHYADVQQPLVMLHIDESALTAAGVPWRFDPVPGSDTSFPHVYGPIPVAAVVAAVPACRRPDGDWEGFPEGA